MAPVAPPVPTPMHQRSKLFETHSVQYEHRYLPFVYLGFFYIGDLGSCHFHDPPILSQW